jgi:hypothetical protein
MVVKSTNEGIFGYTALPELLLSIAPHALIQVHCIVIETSYGDQRLFGLGQICTFSGMQLLVHHTSSRKPEHAYQDSTAGSCLTA